MIYVRLLGYFAENCDKSLVNRQSRLQPDPVLALYRVMPILVIKGPLSYGH